MHCCEKGRSMIEMLGVLAIVGVLSIGGIAGYTQAMDKYKVTKLMDQLSQTVIGIRTMYLSESSFKNLNTQMLLDLGAIPSGQFDRSGSSIKIIHAFNGELKIFISQMLPNDNAAFEIYAEGISEKACRFLISSDWGQDPNSGFIGLYLGIGETITEPKLLNLSDYVPSDPATGIYTSGMHEYALPLGPLDAQSVCHCPTSDCVIGLKYM